MCFSGLWCQHSAFQPVSSPTGFLTVVLVCPTVHPRTVRTRAFYRSFPPRLALPARLSFSCTSMRSLGQQQCCRLSQPIFPVAVLTRIWKRSIAMHFSVCCLTSPVLEALQLLEGDVFVSSLAITGCLAWTHLCVLQTLFQSKDEINQSKLNKSKINIKYEYKFPSNHVNTCKR